MPPTADRPLAVLASRIRVEEKRLLEELDRRGVPYQILDSRNLVFRLEAEAPPYSGLLVREVSYNRGLYAARLFEHAGLPVVNKPDTIALCGDKLRTALALSRAGLPIPRTMLALTPGGARTALDDFGYPNVVKPLVGSWGRLAARLTGPDAAQAVLEHRDALPDPLQRITLVQEYIDAGHRDIRVLVFGELVFGAIYRISDEWRANTRRGARVAPCPLDDEIVDLALRAAAAVGGGTLAVDLLEGAGGRYVNEVNATPEFAGAMGALGDGLAAAYVDHVLQQLDAG
jgi:[lysine-biosynthesis-protein LysW]---L-2-aminoadipate ligase